MRKMLKFLDKNIIRTADFKVYPYISIQVSNFMIIKFVQKLEVVIEREESMYKQQPLKPE